MTTTAYTLPKLLKLTEATIFIPSRLFTNNISDYERQQREITHVLALLPDADKATADLDDDGFCIRTSSLPALRYAAENGFICKPLTCIDAVVGDVVAFYRDNVSDEIVEEFIDKALDSDFEVVHLNDGISIQFSGEAN